MPHFYSNRAFGYDLASGAVLGLLGAFFNQSNGTNLISNAAAVLAGNGISTWLGHQKFWSQQTALSTLTATAAGSLTHMVAQALIHQHHYPEPKIAYAPDCNCKWQHGVAKSSSSEMGR